MTSQHHKRLASLLCAVFLLGAFLSSAPVQAESSTPEALIAAVNALRAARGLAPYQVDAGLMAYSQQHTVYQASIQTSTHLHSDGSVPADHGLVENVAGGDLGFLTAEFAVYTIWADAVHMKTMIGYRSGWIGAGVANDGKTEYYTIDVRPGNVPPDYPGKGTPAGTPTKPIPLAPLITMTPRANGCTIHVVGYGQSLWAIAIAYGVKMDAIRGLNGMDAGSTDIYAGQWLVIRCAPVTKTAMASETSTFAETTPAPTSVPVTVFPTESPTAVEELAALTGKTPEASKTIEAIPTVVDVIGSGTPPTLVAGMLILAGGTLLVLVAFALMKGNSVAR